MVDFWLLSIATNDSKRTISISWLKTCFVCQWSFGVECWAHIFGVKYCYLNKLHRIFGFFCACLVHSDLIFWCIFLYILVHIYLSCLLIITFIGFIMQSDWGFCRFYLEIVTLIRKMSSTLKCWFSAAASDCLFSCLIIQNLTVEPNSSLVLSICSMYFLKIDSVLWLFCLALNEIQQSWYHNQISIFHLSRRNSTGIPH